MVNLHEEEKVRNSEICFYQISSFANSVMILLLIIPIVYGHQETRPKFYSHLQLNNMNEVTCFGQLQASLLDVPLETDSIE